MSSSPGRGCTAEDLLPSAPSPGLLARDSLRASEQSRLLARTDTAREVKEGT